MDRIEFLQEIFNFFRIDAIKNEHLLIQYDSALTTREPIDWQKLYDITLKEAETRTLPAPRYFIDKFSRCIKPDVEYANDGKKVKLKLKKYEYDFETYKCDLDWEQVKEKAIRKYKGQFECLKYFDELTQRWITV